jgi:hypothetical protein
MIISEALGSTTNSAPLSTTLKMRFGFTVPIPTLPALVQLRIFTPPAISEPVSAPALPIPVSSSL